MQFEDSMVLSGKQMALLNSVYRKNIPILADVEFKVFSQWGEDGIFDWLIEKLSPMPEIFIEFGVQDYSESNTRFLMTNRNWRGLIMDASRVNMERVRANDYYWQRDLTAGAHFITRENIATLIKDYGFDGEIGILSIDIDGNDYWIWEAIDNVNPVIVCCEFSAIFGDVHPISIPYMQTFARERVHYSGQYFGASIKALLHLAGKKGYTFVGTPSNGTNAFFVRNDHLTKLQGSIQSFTAFPGRHTDTRDANGILTFERGEERFNLIKHLPVENVITGENMLLQRLDTIYSDIWKKQMLGKI